jgi:hypothetical protein
VTSMHTPDAIRQIVIDIRDPEIGRIERFCGVAAMAGLALLALGSPILIAIACATR